MRTKASFVRVRSSKRKATETANGAVVRNLVEHEAQATMVEVSTMMLVGLFTKCLQLAAVSWISLDGS